MNKRFLFNTFLLFATMASYAQSNYRVLNTQTQTYEQIDRKIAVNPFSPSSGNYVPTEKKVVGSSKQIVLLIGDSMVGKLAPRFNDYAIKNNFEFHSEVWIGSTIRDWALAADLQYQIDRFRPTYVIISLGINDLGYHDYTRREEAVKTILQTIGDIPYTWIGPLHYSRFPNRTIVDIIKGQTGKGCFFDSSSIQAKRVDGLHPTQIAANFWVDKVVDWMAEPSLASHPLSLEDPDFTSAYIPDEHHGMGYHGRR